MVIFGVAFLCTLESGYMNIAILGTKHKDKAMFLFQERSQKLNKALREYILYPLPDTRNVGVRGFTEWQE